VKVDLVVTLFDAADTPAARKGFDRRKLGTTEVQTDSILHRNSASALNKES
jgi:hypothetical protein